MTTTSSHAEMGWTLGTLRERPPEETWDSILALLRTAGCTRVADVTRLDPSGLPVHMAIRPVARSLAVAAGKGVTPALSRVSAAMEAIEFWYAEHPPDASVRSATARELDIAYPLHALELANPSLLHERFPLDWVQGTSLASSHPVFVPRDYVSLDRRSQPRAWAPPLFQVGTNGLASGNTRREALVHALCEVIERDTIWRNKGLLYEQRIDELALEDESVQRVLAAIVDSGGNAELYNVPTPLGVPTVAALIRDAVIPLQFGGSGTSPDPTIAVTRALTEAVQQRAALISGTRDDIPVDLYEKLRQRRFQKLRPKPDECFALPPALDAPSLDALVDELVDRITTVTGLAPLAVDYTSDEDPIAVVRVIAPGLNRPRLGGFPPAASRHKNSPADS